MLNLFKTTQYYLNWWRIRKIDWNESYLKTSNHPHRNLIVSILRNFHWLSLIEVGCGSGANLVNIVKHFSGKQLGGVDINSDAIELAQKTLSGALLKVGKGDDIMLSDNSTDVVLSDMCLIYVSPKEIKNYLREMKRIARNHIVLCEFHSNNWWKRLALKIKTGYNAYDWRRLLQSEGFFDILEYKLTEEDWPKGEPQKTYGFIFIARVPRR